MNPRRRVQLYVLWAILFAVGAALLIWSLRTVSLREIARALAGLQLWHILVIFLVNSVIVVLFPLRWWLILRAQGHRLPYIATVRYRLAASALSYFSPGQHFGGEPLQVLMLQRRHKLSGSTALASVTLDRAIEIFGNFAVLVIGILVLFTSNILDAAALRQALPISVVALVLLLAYLLAMSRGWRPLGQLTAKSENWLAKGLRHAEIQLGELIQKRPGLFLEGLGVSALVWAVLVVEFWLMLVFLGLTPNATELIAIVVASRIALFAPTPGALGALEASQVFAFQSLGFDAAIGLSFSLLIRGRDILFSLLGLLWNSLIRP